METGQQMMALITRNHGEEITAAQPAVSKGEEDDDVMDDVIHFSFSFSFIPVKSFI